jgi:hypothetical protein
VRTSTRNRQTASRPVQRSGTFWNEHLVTLIVRGNKFVVLERIVPITNHEADVCELTSSSLDGKASVSLAFRSQSENSNIGPAPPSSFSTKPLRPSVDFDENQPLN